MFARWLFCIWQPVLFGLDRLSNSIKDAFIFHPHLMFTLRLVPRGSISAQAKCTGLFQSQFFNLTFKRAMPGWRVEQQLLAFSGVLVSIYDGQYI